jgi:hypothetical protein
MSDWRGRNGILGLFFRKRFVLRNVIDLVRLFFSFTDGNHLEGAKETDN